MNAYDWILLAQDASNLKGILNDVSRFIQAVEEEVARGEYTGEFGSHPLMILLGEKIHQLTGYGQDYEAAYRYCQARAQCRLD